MAAIARAERDAARRALELVPQFDALDLALRLDMGCAATEEILQAKVEQIDRLLAERLPAWREQLQRW